MPSKEIALALGAALLCLPATAQKTISTFEAPLNAEARNQNLRVWQKEYVKCGDSYYGFTGGVYIGSGGRMISEFDSGPREIQPKDYVAFREYKGASFAAVTVKAEPVSEADRLNGIQWRSWVASPSFSAYRTRDRLDGKWGEWTEWKNIDNAHRYVQGTKFVKRAGQWLMELHVGELVPIERWLKERQMPSCADLPLSGPSSDDLKAEAESQNRQQTDDGITKPVIVYKVAPDYSEEARVAKYQGTVLLRVTVDTDGKAKNVRLAKSLGLGLDQKAIECVQKWKFTPGKKNGEPVSVDVQLEVNFRLL